MKRILTSCYLGALLAGGLAAPAAAQVVATYPVGATTVTLSNLTTGLDTPWELLWGPDNFLWMTERGGRISRINPTTGQLLPLLTLSDVTQGGESGLLGMTVVPIASTQGGSAYVFVVYNYTDGGLKEKVVRYTYTNGTLTAPLVILGNIPAANIHSGSRLLALPDNTLLVTTGDAANTSLSQNSQSLNGKILRMNFDGTVPANNPTPGSLVYTIGHRNPQGLVRVAATGRVYSSEHGPSNDDEVNLIEPGRNYGWPNVEGLCNLPAEQTFCQQNNVREPLAVWTPTLAVAGITYYDHPAIPGWRNSLLMASLKAGTLTQLILTTGGEAIAQQANVWAGTYGRLRAICTSPQGRVYVATSNRDGRGNPAAQDDRVMVLENRAFVTSAKSTRTATFALYPNPSTTSTTLQLPAKLGAATGVEVVDALGRQVYNASFPAGQQRAVLPSQAWSPGVYTVRVASPGLSFTPQRLVLAR
ncbi:PQQ-dependent sugar dehydrogenase [Hymenobacter koreensis]|uniref:PQQ-dependent sugar dehydrogenase n=1 Tax=Hymenobacter koreensis TaxID=1084523 RepID=A0ABP8IX34_9BACT